MASQPSDGSPAARGRTSAQFSILDEGNLGIKQDASTRQASSTSKQGAPKHTITFNEGPAPLSTSKLANLQAPASQDNGPKKLKSEHSATSRQDDMQPGSMDSLLAKLSEQQVLLAKQKSALTNTPDASKQLKDGSSTSSTLLTPASETFSSPTDGGQQTARIDMAEMARLKKELDDAKEQIARQKQELDQSRVNKHTFDHAMGPPSDAALSPPFGQAGAFTASQRPLNTLQGAWRAEDARSDGSDVIIPINNGSNVWSGAARSGFNAGLPSNSAWGQQTSRVWGQRGVDNPMPPPMMSQQPPMQQRNYSVPISPPVGGRRGINDFDQFNQSRGFGQNNRNASVFQPGGWNNYAAAPGTADGLNLGGMNPGSAYPSLGVFPPAYQPQPIGTPLSPTATEFRTGPAPGNPWNNSSSVSHTHMVYTASIRILILEKRAASPGPTYVSPMEPLNYRRLLDRSVTCDWKYIVDKIICNNDQQASIFLQQKLKVGTSEQKFEIIEAIVAQAYPLMVNRFGNFLVQRCFEHGTPEQVVFIANAIRGNTLSLSMDAFGCHVVQKAFDAVPEDYKAIMVHELLRRIPETVIHRYACHVWQKLFELRWSDSPPQIMKYVNEALCGMWHEVALGETGSLVVQNIFENCLEEDKRPCISEVLNSIDIVAHGQFGNWCIQHICEHGAPADRSRAIDHVLRYATEYSMDQFASKVVEKCLKIGGADFLERYLERVCEGRADRPRIPLIDIASDQYGNYLIQYILTHANPNHRDIVASHIRKHMVSLRGSKFGSRVGMLCCNPAYATHPGPGVGPPPQRSFTTQSSNIPRFGGAYR
ncbi:pumilio RNA-binding family, partial [Lecanoromycetidae sp. Uapishka_2]